LLWTTWILSALAASCPLFDFFPPGLRPGITNPGMILHFIGGVYAVFWFLLYILGKIVCVVLVVLVVLVVSWQGIATRTRLVTAAAGILTCCLLLYWVSVTNHAW
jgi:hypothetical protein